MKQFTQRVNGEWFRIAKRGHIIACCDCGLVHHIKIRDRDGGGYEMRANRLPDMTRKRRRQVGVTVKRGEP